MRLFSKYPQTNDSAVEEIIQSIKRDFQSDEKYFEILAEIAMLNSSASVESREKKAISFYEEAVSKNPAHWSSYINFVQVCSF